MDLVHTAAQWGLDKMVARLIEDNPTLLNAANEYGWTSLMLACSRGHISLVKWLIDQGVDLNQRDLDGFTALTHAACGRKGKTEVVALLLKHGADPNRRCRRGSTVLMEASTLGFAESIQCLLQHGGAEVDARDEKGSTALFKVGR
jgi:ankyrin repeat protein